MFVVAENDANVISALESYLIDLSVYGAAKSKNQFSKINRNQSSRSQACSGFISSVRNDVLVKIVFNDLINTNFNFSWINNTNTQMYVKPGSNR